MIEDLYPNPWRADTYSMEWREEFPSREEESMVCRGDVDEGFDLNPFEV